MYNTQLNGSINSINYYIILLFYVLIDNIECKYVGSKIGKLNIYHHGVSGEVYAVNETSILIQNFYYDGLGKDTFFWAGQNGSPSSQGFIIPDQFGSTNILEKYENVDIVLTLPDGKKISELSWFSIYDLTRLVTFGDVYIPDGFQPPEKHSLGPFIIRSELISSETVIILDSKRFQLGGFSLNVDDDVYFWVGKGHSPSQRGHILIADENGYFEPIRHYNNEDIILILPGELTIDTIDWLAIYHIKSDKALAYIIIPNDINVPPNLSDIQKIERSLPNCEQLHSDLQISWDITGQTITIELIGLMDDDEWIGFGISGSKNSSEMIGSDIAIGWLGKNGQGNIQDFNIDAKAICTRVLETTIHGVCPDNLIGKSDSIQLLEARRNNGITIIKYRRQLIPNEINDLEFKKEINIIYAIGRIINENQHQFGFHRIYNKYIKWLNLNEINIECYPFIIEKYRKNIKPWGEVKIVDGKLRAFTARLGPSGGQKGYEGLTGLPSPGITWYIHGYLAPALYMQRGLTYSFRVEGGNNPHNIQGYHPFIISTGPNPLTSIILAGIERTRRGQSRPIAAGRLCIWQHNLNNDRRLDDNFQTFEKYRNSLKLRCENNSEPSILEIIPNSTWPDIVYYGSYTSPNMGWKIYIVDSISITISNSNSSSSSNGCFYLLFIYNFLYFYFL